VVPALKEEEVAISQRMQVVPKSWKQHLGSGFCSKAPEETILSAC
jgi:hypothetical protein